MCSDAGLPNNNTKQQIQQNTVGDSEDDVKKMPNLDVAQLRFLLSHTEIKEQEKAEIWQKFIELIKSNEMAPYYVQACKDLRSNVDAVLLSELEEKNQKRLKEIDDEIKDAEVNHGETEIRQAYLHKSEYYCQIGEKKRAVVALTDALTKTVSVGYRVDLYFSLIRHGLFFLDHQQCNLYITRAKDLLERDCGDWERRNRLRAYEGLHEMSVRDFKRAAALFLDVVQTFSSTELMSYDDLIFYTVVCCAYSLQRQDLLSKVIQCNEIQEQLVRGREKSHLLTLKRFLHAFYNCKYDDLVIQLAELEEKCLKFDRYFAPHACYYSKAILLRAYIQYLSPYAAVRLDVMAKHFGVSVNYIDKTLHNFIGSGQLRCNIDAVRGIVTTMHLDSTDSSYKNVIKDGDLLLNRIQNVACAMKV